MRTALVTGSAGFIGRHLVPKLRDTGYECTAIDYRPYGETNVHASFEAWIETRTTFHGTPTFDVVVHLAAHIPDISERMRGGLHQYQDIALDWAMANYIKEHPPRECFIVPSSCAVDAWETDPYAFCKMTAERFWMQLHYAGIPVVILKPYSGYGHDQALTYPFPAILDRALKHEDPLTVWGSLGTVRDFVHIDDLTDAFVHAIDKFPRGVPVPIGTGIGTNFGHLARRVADAVGYKPEISANTAMPTSSAKRIANTQLAESFGFKAKISLEEGIRKAVEVLSQKNELNYGTQTHVAHSSR